MRKVLLVTLLLVGLSIVPGFVATPAMAWDPGLTDWCSRLNMNPGPLQPVFDIVCHPGDLPP